MLKIGSRVMVHAYKHDGTLYRSWEKPHVVYDDGDLLVLYNKFVRVYDANQKPRFSKEDTFWVFYRDRWLNVQITVREQGELSYYVNIAGPFLVEDGAVKYVDYDLDFKISITGAWKEVDLNEFKTNSRRYAYPPSVIDSIKNVERDVSEALKAGVPLVDKRLFNEWYERVIKPMRAKFINRDAQAVPDVKLLQQALNKNFARRLTDA